jgi:predicted phage tail protein
MNNERYRPWLSLQGAEQLVKKHVGDDKNEAADALVKAASGITEASQKLCEDVPVILNNKLGSSLANAKAARAAIAKIVDPALKRADVAINFGHAAIETLKKQSDPKAPSDAMGATQHAEVRSALLRMTTPERHKAIETAIASGDETFLSAAVSGSPTLSGMTAEQQMAAKEKWRGTRHADTASKIAHLSNAIAQLERIAPMLTKWSSSLVDEPSAMAVAAAEATAARAKAVS